MKKDIFLLFLFLIIIIIGIVTPVFASSHQGIKVGFSFMSNQSFFKVMLKEIRQQVEGKFDGKLIVSNAKHNIAEQIVDIEEMVEDDIELLLFNAVDSQAAEVAVSLAGNAGIPVVCLDVDVEGSRDIFIGSDNYQAGLICGRYVVKRLHGKGKIVILNGNPVSSVRKRYNGFMDVINKYSDIKIVDEQNGDGDLVKSLEVTENILQSSSEIDAIYAINDPSALGALKAVQSAGRENEMFIVGIDGSPDAIQAIINGTAMAATAAQYPAKIGKLGVEYGLKLLEGKNVPDFLSVDVKLITEDNANNFSW